VTAAHRSGSPLQGPEPGTPQESVRGATGRYERAPLVGRAREMERAIARLQVAGAGQGGLVAISGEAGIGKTRLLEHLAFSAQASGFFVPWSRALEGDWQPSYHAWVEVLTQAVSELHWPVAGSAPPDWAPPLLPIVPALAHLFPAIAPPGALGMREERFRLADAITHALHDLAQHRPLLVVIDDIQWSDSETLRVLQHVAGFPLAAPLLIAVAFRDAWTEASPTFVDVMGSLRRGDRFDEIALQGVDATNVAEIMNTIHAGTVPDDLVRQVQETTHGNPFYVQELTRHLHEEGQIAASRRPSAFAPASQVSIPESLRQVVDSRLARLSAPTQRMLRLAAVCTDGFDFPILRALTSLPEDDVLDAIDEALAARLIAPVAAEAERYDFQHDLVRRALYDGWSPSRRVRLHRALAESLAQVHKDTPHLYARAIAAHYHVSVTVPGAEAGVPHALAAARNAQRRFAPEEAATCFRIARDLAAALPAGERAAISATLTLAEANALWLDAALASATETVFLMEESGVAPADQARFLADAVTGLHDGGQAPELWHPLLYRGLALVDPSDEVTWARLTLLIERFEPVSAGPVRGARWLGSDARAIAIARSSGDEDLFARSLQPWDLWDRDWTEHLSAQITTWHKPTAIIRALTVSGADWLYHHGEFRRARSHFENLLAIAERHGSIPGQAEATVRLGIIHTALGNLTEARAFERSASAFVEHLGRGHRLHASLWWLRAFLREIDDGNWDDIAAYFTSYIADPTTVRRTIAFDDAALASLALARAGRASEARGLLRPLIEVLGSLEPTLWLLNGTVAFAASTAWALEARDLAGPIHDRALAVIAAGHDDFPCCSNLLSVARVAALLDQRGEARAHFEAARAHLDLSGQRPLRAMVDLDEARMLAEGEYGERDEAIVFAASARDRFTELGMTAWAGRAGSLLAHLEQRQQEPRAIPGGLSLRELDVVRRIARGYSDRQIGDDIFISPRTVNAHVRNILAKTHLKNRTELSLWAVEHGLVTRDAPD